MKTRFVTFTMFVLLGCLLAGCAEYAGGVATGAAAMKKVLDDSQDRFVTAVNELNVETERLNDKIETVKNIEVTDFIKPETIKAIESLKGREKDPALWIGLASLLLGGTGVNLWKNKVK